MKRLHASPLIVPWWVFWLALLLLAAAAFTLLFLAVEHPRTQALFGGLLGGVVILIFNYLLDLHLVRELERFETMGVHGLLSNRHDQAYYRNVLKGAVKSVRCMGTSCRRFVDDFLDPDNEDAVLIDGLRRYPKLTVQLLVPSETHMDEDSRNSFESIRSRVGQLEEQYPGRFEVRRFERPAAHSMVIADESMIVGPVLEGDKSKHTPAIHLSMTTPYAERCASYFDRLWGSPSDG